MSNSLSHNITGGNQVREIIGSRLREERERLGLTQTEFAQMGEASKRSQTDWEQGKLVPNGEFLANIAEYGADIGYILTGERNGNKLSEEESQYLMALRQLDERGKDCMLGMLVAMSSFSPVPGQPQKRDFSREMQLLGIFRQLSPDLKEAVEIAAKSFLHTSVRPAADTP